MSAEQGSINQLEQAGIPNYGHFQFNPEGAMWEINRNRVGLLIGGRALALQLAEPHVAAAIDRTGKLQKDPFHRLQDTARKGMGLIYGTPEEARAIARDINRMHTGIRGKLQEGVGAYPKGHEYNAFDQDQQAWVGATIIDTTILGQELFVAPLSRSRKDEYVNEAKNLFRLMGLKLNSLPWTYQGIQDYIRQKISSGEVKVGPQGKKLLPYALMSHTLPHTVLSSYIRLTTIATLPPEIRAQYGMRITPAQERFFDRSTKFVGSLFSHLPGVVSQTPEYREARRQIEEENVLFDLDL